MIELALEKLDWQKMDGLIPAIVQHADTGDVLMLAYMNKQSLELTLANKQVTFFSRSKQRLWTKGESSGHYLTLKTISTDCDGDSLLLQVLPEGPTCHLGFQSCFQPPLQSKLSFLTHLIQLVEERATLKPAQSYITSLLAEGVNRCAQKVGEESVETVIAAVTKNRAELINEASDLVFHLLVLLQACELSFYELLDCLKNRAKHSE